MSSLPVIEVFLRAVPLEAVVISDPPVEVSQPIFQTINVGNFATAEQGAKADTAVQPEAIASFETTEQLNARDTANRNRANHSGTQAMETIEGLELALGGKATVAQGELAETALQPNSDISLLTNDAGYLTANSVPDGVIIGGNVFFVRPPNNGLAPAIRPNGSPLVLRDKWYNTSDGTEWIWNGSYWLSVAEYNFTGAIAFAGGTTGTLTCAENIPINHRIGNVYFFLESITRRVPITGDNTNYWSFQPSYFFANNNFNSSGIGATIDLKSSPTNHGKQTVNLLISGSGLTVQPRTFAVLFAKFGNAPNITNAMVTFTGRQVFP